MSTWILRGPDYRFGDKPKQLTGYEVYDGDKWIASVLGEHVRNSAQETTRNAHLIAAAPELLSACEMLSRWMERDLQDEPELEELTLQTVYKHVENAIAKAKGQS